MKVFLSYAREDVELVDRLSGALTRRGFEVLIDRKDIEALDEWRKQLERLIRKADAAIFVLSPDWLASSMCSWELEQSMRYGKRLAPIVAREPGAKVPPALSAIQYVLFTTGQDVDTQAGVLATALNSDAAWSRAHTRYQDLAERWDELKRPDDHCLAGQEAKAARRWLRNRPAVGAALTALQRQFIDRSVYVNSWTYKALQAVSLSATNAGDQLAANIGRVSGEAIKYLFRFLLVLVWCVIRAIVYVLAMLRLPYWRWVPITGAVAIAGLVYQEDIERYRVSVGQSLGIIRTQNNQWAEYVEKHKPDSVSKADVEKLTDEGALVTLESGAEGIIEKASLNSSGAAVPAGTKGIPVRIVRPDAARTRFVVEPLR